MITLKNEAGYLDLSKAVQFSDTATNGCLTIIRTNSGSRTKISKELLKAIGTPASVDFYFIESQVIVVPASEKSGSAMKIGKGEIVYSTQLAEKIMKLAGGEFPENKSTKIGSYTVEMVDETTSAAVITFDSSTTHAAETAHEKEVDL